MRQTILLITLAIFLCSACAQENKKDKQITVPEVVKKAFSAKFVNAKKVEWGLEKEGEFEAEFKLNKSEMSAVFDKMGKLLELFLP